jgi:hypothetical protein
MPRILNRNHKTSYKKFSGPQDVGIEEGFMNRKTTSQCAFWKGDKRQTKNAILQH